MPAERLQLGLGEERVPPGEADAIAEIDRMTRARGKQTQPARPVRREQHPKTHGCVRAEFVVGDDVPEALRHGLFREARTYRAWVRFSPNSPEMASDAKRDAQGMAIKVLGVPGEKVLPEERDETTHDFVLANSRTFFVRTAADYVTFVQRIMTDRLPLFFVRGWKPWEWRLLELVNLVVATQQRVHNPLQIRYWSQTPYRLGPHAVKYSARPTGARTDRKPISSSPGFLREAMARQLRTVDVLFDLMVQRQTDPVRMPVEDAAVLWSERRSPFQKVATVRIPAQEFDTAARHEFAENLSLTPWHALPEHRPLGGINRTRGVVYASMSTLRHEANQAPRREPGEDEVP